MKEYKSLSDEFELVQKLAIGIGYLAIAALLLALGIAAIWWAVLHIKAILWVSGFTLAWLALAIWFDKKRT